jgi:signal transduction histidine kinase
VLLALGAVAVIAYAVVRGIAARLVDRLVIAETREQSRILAIEEERQRLARDLHDEPLQRLAGVIKDLERDGGSPAETSVLMEIADDLRGLATDLRPPALDDLGLVPALTGLTTEGPPRIRVELDDRTGYDAASRLPADVELALYRIAAEAIRNAIQHSGGTMVSVTGEVAPDRAAIVIADDGRGIDDARLRARQRDGHLGMSTMRQRATLAGATLAIDTSGAGVRVRVAWARR